MRLLATLALCVPLMGQVGTCYTSLPPVAVSSGCPATGSPTIQAYIAAFNTFLKNTWPTIFGLPQPPIKNDLQMVGMSASWIENCPTTGTCVYNSASTQEAFTANIVEGSGATGVVVNLDYMPYMLSTEYTTATGHACSGTYAAATCTRLSTNLAFYDTMMKYWLAQGLTIRLAPISFGVPGGGSPWLICGLTPSTMTVAQRLACEEPYLAAMVAHTHNLSPSVSIATVIAAHEPTEVDAASTGQTLSVADWNTLIAGLCPAVHNATGGSGVLCGSGYAMADGSYVTNVTSSVPSGMQVFGLDVYFRDFGSSPSWTDQAGVYAGWASTAIGAGLQFQIDESGPPGYCPSGSNVSCQAELINGCGWPSLQTYGVTPAFWHWLSRWASANGAVVSSLFYDQPLALLQTGSCSDATPVTSYTWQMLSNLPGAPTVTGNSWQGGNYFGATSLHGVSVSGTTVIQ
jgi:hypothetical protein